MVQSVTVLTGHGKDGTSEAVDLVELRMGDIVSIVGPTGSGKTTLINDIELLANGDTPTGRRILIDGQTPPASYREDPAKHPIALITQHTHFLSDLSVNVFLTTHVGIRSVRDSEAGTLVQRTLDFANQLTGEAIHLDSRMTELSGGQTRALMIADATIVCDTPIVLLDEVENAGIHRTRALDLLREHRKIFVFVTHDPRVALLSDFRVVMQNGRITQVLHTDGNERKFAATVNRIDDWLSRLRDIIRVGGRLSEDGSRELSASSPLVGGESA